MFTSFKNLHFNGPNYFLLQLKTCKLCHLDVSNQMFSISTRLVIFECEILVKTCRTSSPKQTFLLREQKPKSQKSHYSKFTKGARSSVLPHNNQHSSVLMAVSSCDSGGGKAAERWMQKKRTASGFQAQLTKGRIWKEVHQTASEKNEAFKWARNGAELAEKDVASKESEAEGSYHEHLEKMEQQKGARGTRGCQICFSQLILVDIYVNVILPFFSFNQGLQTPFQ